MVRLLGAGGSSDSGGSNDAAIEAANTAVIELRQTMNSINDWD